MRRFLAVVVALPFGAFATYSAAQDATKPAQWREWLQMVVADIETSVRKGDSDLLARRINRPVEFLASSHGLPASFNVRIYCTLAAQSAANFATSVRQRKAQSARSDLGEFRRYDKDCGDAIAKLDRDLSGKRADEQVNHDFSRYPATPTTPAEWLSAVRYDAMSAREAAPKANMDVLRAIAGSALAHRAKIAAWTPAPKTSEAYGICGDVVIALARVAVSSQAALDAYDDLEPKCAAAIGVK